MCRGRQYRNTSGKIRVSVFESDNISVSGRQSSKPMEFLRMEVPKCEHCEILLSKENIPEIFL